MRCQVDPSRPLEGRASEEIGASQQELINWAYEELAPAAQILLRWLATDYQPIRAAVAEALGGCLGLDPRRRRRLIPDLLECGLLQPHPGYRRRLLLHEEIRSFLLAKLGPDEELAASIALATARRVVARGASYPTNPQGIAYQADAPGSARPTRVRAGCKSRDGADDHRGP